MYYENQDDNYKQDHYQLHWNQVFENNLVSNLGLHYTYGRGYFENYNIGYDDGISKSPDFIDRRWLDNDFYGLIFSLNKTTDKYNVSIGGSYNIYDGEHYGEYLWYGQDVEKVAEDTDRDFWMTAQEAKEYGIVDEVLIQRELAEKK